METLRDEERGPPDTTFDGRLGPHKGRFSDRGTLLWLSSYPYSPECVEMKLPEVRYL